ncbi:MAG TPA: DUF4249 domain-containing protein [Chitinophagaceae bacterium]
MKKIFFLSLVIITGCREIYSPPVNSPDTGYLVVEGFINSTGITTIKLSRTTKLSGGDTIIFEYGATVTIESDNNEIFLLTEPEKGTYVSDELNLTPTGKYKLHIKTSGGKEYISDPTPYRLTPAIDSITWKRENGLQIFVNTHDPQNSTRYYTWKYEETWEYHSTYPSSLKYRYEYPSPAPVEAVWRNALHIPDSTLFRCWKSEISTNILIGSSEKLSSDVIYFLLYTIPPASEQLSVLYSVNLKQFAISRENYYFLQKMKKNTEQLGSIFDAQPTELKGNIHCTTDSNEIVVGYIDVSQERSKRIFISNAEVPDWNYNPGCFEHEIENNRDSIYRKWQGHLQPTVPIKINILTGIVSFGATEKRCMDCTYEGRSNIKPDFWP